MHQQQKNHKEMAYHYAGKVHVRGLLRRVWRPRYLALGDDGYLRYHESIPPLFQQMGNAYSNMYSNMVHHTHRPKTILAILEGARAIDPYSVVDQHVALPQGVYGFVFRGKEVELVTTSSASSSIDTSVPSISTPLEGNSTFRGNSVLVSKSNNLTHSTKAAVVNLVFPKGTSRRRTAQKLAKAAINPDVLCCNRGGSEGIKGTGARISGSGLSSSSSSLVDYEQDIDKDYFNYGKNSDSVYLSEENFSKNRIGNDREFGGHGSVGINGVEDTFDSLNFYHDNERKQLWSPCLDSPSPCVNTQVDLPLSQNYSGKDAASSSKTQVSLRTLATPVKLSNPLNDPSSSRATPTLKVSTPATIKDQSTSLQSREYLCAVTTAEEAESWVVALRWAAERSGCKHNKRKDKDINQQAGNESGGSYISRSSRGLQNNIFNHCDSSGGVRKSVGTKRSISSAGSSSNSESKKVAGSKTNFSERERSIQQNTNNDLANTDGKSDNGTCGDSKESLTSLLSEDDGWCKAEKEKNYSIPGSFENNESSFSTTASMHRVHTPTSSQTGDIKKTGIISQAEPVFVPSLTPTDDSSEKYSKTCSTPPIMATRNASHGGANIVVTKVSTFRLPAGSLSQWLGKNHSSLPIPSNKKGATNNRSNNFIFDNLYFFCPISISLPGSSLDFEYKIKLLILKGCQLASGEATSQFHNEVESAENPVSVSLQPQSTEERDIFKSIDDILRLIHCLLKEFRELKFCKVAEEDKEGEATPQQSGKSTPSTQSMKLKMLEDIESELLACSTAINNDSFHKNDQKGMFFSLCSRVNNFYKSIDVVENAMRLLSRDGDVCCSPLFLEFLCLDHSKPSHGASMKLIEKEKHVHQFVQEWLLQRERPLYYDRLGLCLALIARHRLGGPLLSIFCLFATTRYVTWAWSMIFDSPLEVSIPLETYFSLIAAVFYFGHDVGMSSRTHQPISYLLKHRSTPKSHAYDTVLDSKEKHFSDTELLVDDDESTVVEEESGGENVFFGEIETSISDDVLLPSPLPIFPANGGKSCWSKPNHNIFMVRGPTYLEDRVKIPSAPPPFPCRGVDVWITDNAERNISQHPSVLGGKLAQEDTLIVNFLLPFCNFVAYFTVPPLDTISPKVASVWRKFIKGDQQYRDGKLKLLSVVVDGPWIVRKAVGPGTSPAVIGRDLPLQYYFEDQKKGKKDVYEVDVLISASRIARGILNVVKGQTKALTIAFAFIIEASEEDELPETVLCAFQVHSIHLEDCPELPECHWDDP